MTFLCNQKQLSTYEMQHSSKICPFKRFKFSTIDIKGDESFTLIINRFQFIKIEIESALFVFLIYVWRLRLHTAITTNTM